MFILEQGYFLRNRCDYLNENAFTKLDNNIYFVSEELSSIDDSDDMVTTALCVLCGTVDVPKLDVYEIEAVLDSKGVKEVKSNELVTVESKCALAYKRFLNYLSYDLEGENFNFLTESWEKLKFGLKYSNFSSEGTHLICNLFGSSSFVIEGNVSVGIHNNLILSDIVFKNNRTETVYKIFGDIDMCVQNVCDEDDLDESNLIESYLESLSANDIMELFLERLSD